MTTTLEEERHSFLSGVSRALVAPRIQIKRGEEELLSLLFPPVLEFEFRGERVAIEIDGFVIFF